MDAARRNILRGLSPSAPRPVRPPWAIAEESFTDRCTACDKCVDACPQSIVTRGSGGFPEVDFARAECTFCGECAAACPEGVLQRDKASPWSLSLIVLDSCLAKRQVVCNSCADACDAAAIRFHPRLGAVATPSINAEHCTGCGACIAACPESAMTAVVSE